MMVGMVEGKSQVKWLDYALASIPTLKGRILS